MGEKKKEKNNNIATGLVVGEPEESCDRKAHRPHLQQGGVCHVLLQLIKLNSTFIF